MALRVVLPLDPWLLRLVLLRWMDHGVVMIMKFTLLLQIGDLCT